MGHTSALHRPATPARADRWPLGTLQPSRQNAPGPRMGWVTGWLSYRTASCPCSGQGWPLGPETRAYSPTPAPPCGRAPTGRKRRQGWEPEGRRHPGRQGGGPRQRPPAKRKPSRDPIPSGHTYKHRPEGKLFRTHKLTPNPGPAHSTTPLGVSWAPTACQTPGAGRHLVGGAAGSDSSPSCPCAKACK